MAADDAIRYGLGLEAEIEGDSRLEELLAADDREEACTFSSRPWRRARRPIVGWPRTVPLRPRTAP